MICTQCGTQNPDNGAFCVGCGQSLQAAAPAPQYAPPQQYAQPPQYAQQPPQYAAPVDDEAKDAQDNKLMGILSYLGFLWLVPIFAAKESKFAKFHANQGLVLFILEVAYGIVNGILSAIFYAISWRLGSIMGTILGLVYIGIAVLAILGIVNAVKGEKKELPLIGKIKILK
ncbi:MAG: zinc ribbon domain-containing protein [Firmicutes bacterium]|nr:zinc ribbon domain-containing protein [Bacillota bacterium]